MLFSAVFCLIISAVYIYVFYLTGNLSSGAAELQTANGFAYSPYKITLFEAFAALTMQRTAVCAVTGGVFAIISYFLNSYVSIFAAGTVLYGMEFAFFKMNFKAVDVFIKNVNVFSLGTPYFLKRYYSVRLFGESGAFEFSAALTVLIAVGLIVFAAVSNIRVLPARRKNAASKKSKPARKEKSASARGVVYWEIKKRILTPVMVAVLLAGGCARVLLSFYTLKTNGNAAARIYRDYCAVFSRKDLKDAKDDIYEEYSRVQQGLEMKNEAERLKANGSITEEKYDEMIFEYEYSSARARIIEYCTERLDYLFSVSSEDNNVRFVYDTGLEKLLGADFDIVLVLLLLICLSPSFSSEHETGFYPIMNTAKNGRGVTFLAKIVSALIITTALFAVFSVCDICVSYSYGAFDDLSASAVSVEYAANVSPYWSIGGLVARIFAVRYVSYIAFSLLILSLSGIMRKTLAATSISAAAVTVPYGVRALSGSVLPADLSALMAGGLTLCKGTYGTFDFLPFAAASVLTAALTFSYADTGRIRFLRDILRFRKRQG